MGFKLKKAFKAVAKVAKVAVKVSPLGITNTLIKKATGINVMDTAGKVAKTAAGTLTQPKSLLALGTAFVTGGITAPVLFGTMGAGYMAKRAAGGSNMFPNVVDAGSDYVTEPNPVSAPPSAPLAGKKGLSLFSMIFRRR